MFDQSNFNFYHWLSAAVTVSNKLSDFPRNQDSWEKIGFTVNGSFDPIVMLEKTTSDVPLTQLLSRTNDFFWCHRIQAKSAMLNASAKEARFVWKTKHLNTGHSTRRKKRKNSIGRICSGSHASQPANNFLGDESTVEKF